MAIPTTPKMGLRKPDNTELDWNVPYDANMDDIEEQLTKSGTANPNVAEEGHWVGQLYFQTTVQDVWVCIAVGSPGTWVRPTRPLGRNFQVKQSADQTGIDGTRVNCSTITGIVFPTPGADGAQLFKVTTHIAFQAVGGNVQLNAQLHMGTNGDLNDPVIWERNQHQTQAGAGDENMIVVPDFQVIPASGSKLGLSYQRDDGTGNITVFGFGTAPVEKYSYMVIEEIRA